MRIYAQEGNDDEGTLVEMKYTNLPRDANLPSSSTEMFVGRVARLGPHIRPRCWHHKTKSNLPADIYRNTGRMD